VETSKLNVKGHYVDDEYFYQLDGPKSLEILEDACQCDLHDIKYARNKKVMIKGTYMTVHRLGMSGALAYEMHGAARDADVAFEALKESLDKFGGKLQGFKTYNGMPHTCAGIPNQALHFVYPRWSGDPGLADFSKKNDKEFIKTGSAADDPENYYLTPFDVGWGYLVKFDHNFIGKNALSEIAKNPPKKPVTLEWNPDDVADVFISQFKGLSVEPYDAIEFHTNKSDASEIGRVRADYVVADGQKIGIASGKTNAYYERKLISLAFIDKEYAKEGTDVKILWGNVGHPVKEIRATVAKFPYFNENYRNETFDVNTIPKRFS
jgi:glycine cleavage system aminomethyltransferase T